MCNDALILACSQAKRKPGADIWGSEGKAPAVLVYDGPWWRILRKHNPHVQVFALSGKFGLIPSHTFIPHYDCKMRETLSAQWVSNHLLPNAISLVDYGTVWICVPQTGGYATAVELVKAMHSTVVGKMMCDTIPSMFSLVTRPYPTLPAFRDVTEVLELSSDKALLARNPHFARTRALSLFCRERGWNNPMMDGDDAEDWQRLIDDSAILGWER